jgi:hypothetical protein
MMLVVNVARGWKKINRLLFLCVCFVHSFTHSFAVLVTMMFVAYIALIVRIIAFIDDIPDFYCLHKRVTFYRICVCFQNDTDSEADARSRFFPVKYSFIRYFSAQKKYNRNFILSHIKMSKNNSINRL